jgi:hypothetical protein
MSDPVSHPHHYNAHASGIEAITLCEMLSFNLGNALKYMMRADHKGKRAEDRAKAAWYLRREAGRPRRAWTDMVAWQVAGRIVAHEHPATALGQLLLLIRDDLATAPALLSLAEMIERGEP